MSEPTAIALVAKSRAVVELAMAPEYTVMLESASSSDTAKLMTIDELIIESTVKVEQIAIFELRSTDKLPHRRQRAIQHQDPFRELW